MDLPSSATAGTPVRLNLITKGWAFVEPFDGRLILEDGVEPTIHVAPKGSLALLRGGNRLRLLCRIVASVAMSTGSSQLVAKRPLRVDSGKGPRVPSADIREQLLQSMSEETGISKQDFIRELSSWIRDSGRDPGDRALAAWFARDYKDAAEFASTAASEAHLRKVMAAREEAFWLNLRGWAQIERGEFGDAGKSFLSSRSADNRTVDAINGLALVCFANVPDHPDQGGAAEDGTEEAILEPLENCKAVLTKNFGDLFDVIRNSEIANDTDEAQAIFSLESWKRIDVLGEDDILTPEQTQARVGWLLKNTNEVRSWDLDQTLYYATLVLISHDYDGETIPVVLGAIDRALSFGETRYVGANFPSKAGLLTLRARIEIGRGDVIGYVRDARASIDVDLQFDDGDAADLAKDACILLHQFQFAPPERLKEMGVRQSQLPLVLSAEKEMCQRATTLYSQVDSERAAQGHHSIGDALLFKSECASAIQEYDIARKFALEANNLEVSRDAEASMIQAIACLSDTHDQPRGSRILSCAATKQVDAWLPNFQMNEKEVDDESFPDWLQVARAHLEQAKHHCAQGTGVGASRRGTETNK